MIYDEYFGYTDYDTYHEDAHVKYVMLSVLIAVLMGHAILTLTRIPEMIASVSCQATP